MPFLSLLDDRAKPKGSRDPLGFEMVWTHYGRQIIGNLTTITSSLSNFSVALLGFKLANDIHAHLPEHERQAYVRESFLRYEQLAGYLRFLSNDMEIMGISRVRRRMEDPKVKITFGLGSEQQILSDQTSYGLWGFYSSAMRDTGLIKGDDRVLTADGLRIAQAIESTIDRERLVNLFTTTKRVDRADLKSFAKPFHSAITRKKIRNELLDALMNGNKNKVLQQELWRVTQEMALSGAKVSRVHDFIVQVMSKTRSTELKERLADIERVERLLVAANNIFHYCRRKDGESLDNIISKLSSLSYKHLPKIMDFSDVPRAQLLSDILHALLSNKIGDALGYILELNRLVMEQRGGAPWVEIEGGNTLRVRVKSETANLKDQHHLEDGWDYDYFFGSFILLTRDGLGTQWTVR